MAKQLSRAEFIVLVALLSSIMAFSTDAMLPAMPEMAQAFGLEDANRIQLIISTFMLGAGFGQLFFGPFADYRGRKTAILTGLVLFIAGSIIAMNTQDFTTMLAARFLQGIGVAGPRTASIAMVRDLFAGRGMARVMSFVSAVFILVPALAPAIGQAIMTRFGWASVFGAFIVMAIVSFGWMALRQPETNPPQNRRTFSWQDLFAAARTVISNRHTMVYTITGGLFFGSFISYLSSAQQIFDGIFGVGERFPFYFAIMALSIGAASMLNAKLVMKYGMRRLTMISLVSVSTLSFAYLALVLAYPQAVTLGSFLAWGMSSFFFLGIVFGNVNALAMEPMGKIAGVAAALIGAISSTMAVAIGVPLGAAFNGTIIPLVAGFAVLKLLAVIVIVFGDRP